MSSNVLMSRTQEDIYHTPKAARMDEKKSEGASDSEEFTLTRDFTSGIVEGTYANLLNLGKQ